MKRSFSNDELRTVGLLAAGSGTIAAAYGLVRLAYGLFLPDVQSALGFSEATAGLISAGASVMYCLGAVVGFFLASRQPRGLIVAAALSASLGAAGMAAAYQTGVFATFAVVSSAGGGLASPGLVTIVRRNVAGRNNNRSQAIVNAGTGPGLVGAGVLALILLPNWRLAWFLVSACTLAVAAAVLLLDRGPQRDGEEGPRNGPLVPPRSWFAAHRQVIVAAVLLGIASAAVWNYGRTLLVHAGVDDQVSIMAWVALGLGGTAAINTARWISDLLPRTAWSITTMTVAAASVVLGLAPNSPIAALVACAAFGWGYTAGTGALIAWTTRIDAARAAAGTSLLFVILVLGQALGAAAIGLLISFAGFVVAFLAAAAIAILAAAPPFSKRRVADRPDLPVP